MEDCFESYKGHQKGDDRWNILKCSHVSLSIYCLSAPDLPLDIFPEKTDEIPVNFADAKLSPVEGTEVYKEVQGSGRRSAVWM